MPWHDAWWTWRYIVIPNSGGHHSHSRCPALATSAGSDVICFLRNSFSRFAFEEMTFTTQKQPIGIVPELKCNLIRVGLGIPLAVCFGQPCRAACGRGNSR